MRTNIDLDEELIDRAKALSGLQTKRAVVSEALRFYVLTKQQEEIRSFRGKLKWEGDLDESREGRGGDPR